jgi:hypothetical protein
MHQSGKKQLTDHLNSSSNYKGRSEEKPKVDIGSLSDIKVNLMIKFD